MWCDNTTRSRILYLQQSIQDKNTQLLILWKVRIEQNSVFFFTSDFLDDTKLNIEATIDWKIEKVDDKVSFLQVLITVVKLFTVH